MLDSRVEARTLITGLVAAPAGGARANWLAVAQQFLRKEFRIWLGYGSLMLLNLVEIGLLVGTYYFLGALIPNDAVDLYRTDFFSFVLVGIVTHQFAYGVFQAADSGTYREQVWGTLESVLVCPLSPWRYALGNYLWQFVYSCLYTVLALWLGVLLLGTRIVLTFDSVLVTLLFAVLLVMAHLGLGLATMGILLINKAASPLATVIDWTQRLLCGVFYPLAVIPSSLQLVAKFFPLTYGLDAIRRVLLAGEGLTSPEVGRDLCWLLVFSAVLLPAGAGVLIHLYSRARKAGTLGQY
ncbi:MAG TPA: ABC transporter permease [Symbiobacteriaceae bacterium]|nr:ABC transporter permease [Symbiobacteriaceae bacterium]